MESYLILENTGTKNHYIYCNTKRLLVPAKSKIKLIDLNRVHIEINNKDIVVSGELYVIGENCYSYLFESSVFTLGDLKLPSKELTVGCYNHMFSYSSIDHIPENFLPSTELAEGCYWGMFSGCKNLKSIPENLLPATILKDGCYVYMFSSCSNLDIRIKNLLSFIYPPINKSKDNMRDYITGMFPNNIMTEFYELLALDTEN